MSELLAAAAAALGTPEDLVRRSAEARAAESGTSVDDILAAWAGGAQAPAPEAPAGTPPEDEPVSAPVTEPVAAPEVVIEVPAAEAPAPVAAAPAGPFKPPVLVGARDNPMTVLVAAVGLFFVVLLVGLVGPSIQAEEPGSRSSEIPYTATALTGRGVYSNLGCAACHTQMVRPVVADVGLGSVTLNDSNQVLGTRRFGPDLSDVGTRITAGQIEAIITGLGGHPSHSLSGDDMTALVAYLSQSQTSAGSP